MWVFVNVWIREWISWLGCTKVGAAVAAAVTGFIPFRSVPFCVVLANCRDRVENSTRDLLAYYTNCNLLAVGAVDSTVQWGQSIKLCEACCHMFPYANQLHVLNPLALCVCDMTHAVQQIVELSILFDNCTLVTIVLSSASLFILKLPVRLTSNEH